MEMATRDYRIATRRAAHFMDFWSPNNFLWRRPAFKVFLTQQDPEQRGCAERDGALMSMLNHLIGN